MDAAATILILAGQAVIHGIAVAGGWIIAGAYSAFALI
jgi:hypothetical protein